MQPQIKNQTCNKIKIKSLMHSWLKIKCELKIKSLMH